MTGKSRVAAGERPITVTGDPQLRAGQADGLLRVLHVDPMTGSALSVPLDGGRESQEPSAIRPPTRRTR